MTTRSIRVELASALLAACERSGVVFHRSAAVRLTIDGGRASGAELADGTRVPAGQVVLAAGSQSGGLAGVPDEVLPQVRPVKGQVLRLRMPDMPAGSPAFLSRTVRAVVRGGPSTWSRGRTANWSSAPPARSWAGTPP